MNENNKNEIIADEIVDCVGLYCPVPIFETRKKMDSMGKGQILKMMADDPGSKPDMESWARTTGNQLLRVEKEDGVFTFYIEKTE
ncbi:MAG: sulfurtransferase TusA family protein [Actinomycetia bacterium]|nr:sulfurtransferase TusA family protein [Actinomycetes bacterium]